MQKITSFFWFDNNAQEAVKFYTSIFKNSKVTNTMSYGESGPGQKGTIMLLTFEIDGQEFMALNGGPDFSFTPAISLFVRCKTPSEIDDLWEKLSVGGEKKQCGWLQDRYGVSWQIVPTVLLDFLQDSDSEKSQRVMKAMMEMEKLNIAGLKQAYAQMPAGVPA